MTKLTPAAGMPGANSLILAVEKTPAIVLTDAGQRAALFDEIEKEIAAFVPDLTTVKGRNEIKALVTKIVRTKTTADDAGKGLNEEARARIGVIDAARREIRDRLDALRDKARAPLTEWEEAEKARVERVEAVIERLKAAAVVHLGETSTGVAGRRAEIEAIGIIPGEFGDLTQAAEALRQTALDTLAAAIARIAEEEANAAELVRLRQESEERRQREEAARIEAERVSEEARQEEARQAAAAQRAEELRQAQEQAAARAAEDARREADRKAEEARQAQKAEHARQLAEERRKTAEAEAARKADQEARDRAAAAQAAREADARIIEEARQRDTAHRAEVIAKAEAALTDSLLGEGKERARATVEKTAKAAIAAIVAGLIPGVAISF